MDSTLLLQASEVTVPERTPGQFWMTAIVVVSLVVALLVAHRRNKFARLPREQRKHKSALLGSIHDATPETVRIPAGADPVSYRDSLIDAFGRATGRARGEDASHDPDRVTIREAATTVARELHVASGERLPTIPRTARRVGSIAILVAVLGALAVSTEALVRALTRDRSGVSLAAVLGDAVTLTQAVLEAVVDVLGTFPGGHLLADLVFAYTILAATLAYHHWYVLSVVLAIGAVAVALLDRTVPDGLETRLYYHRRTLMLEAIGAATAIWLAGVIPAGLGALVGTVTVPVLGRGFDIASGGAIVGALAAACVASLVAWAAGKSLARRLRHAATIDWADGPDALVAAYLVARYCAVGLALVSVPLVPVYAVVILVEGRLVTVLSAFVASDPLVQLAVVGTVIVAIGGIAYVVRDAHDEVRDALVETLARGSVRAALFQRGMTVFALLVGYGILWSFTRSYLLAPAGALVLAIVVYVGYEAVDRAAYRLEIFSDDAPSRGVLVQCYIAEDADGDTYPVAKVGRDRYTSRETVAETIGDVLTIASAVGERERTVPATAGQQRADDLLELGRVDGDVETELRESIRQTVRYELEPNGRVEMERLKQALEQYPEDMWRGELERYDLLCVVSIDGDTVRLERDVWSVSDRPHGSRWLAG